MLDVGSQRSAAPVTRPFRILSLDGGGAKGFYTLGVLREIEAATGMPLCETFDLVFGTSTGSIIGSLVGLGYSVDEMHALYCQHVPTVMKAWLAAGKTDALRVLAEEILGDTRFDAFRTRVGIVATNWDNERPLIFKSHQDQAHGRKASFVPGMGVTVAEAVQASCSAYPFFRRKRITSAKGDALELIDGGFCANNPTLYAIAEALEAVGRQRSELRVISVGVGDYPPKRRLSSSAANILVTVRLIQKMLQINTASMEQLRQLIYADVPTIRINDAFDKPEMATDMFEHDAAKLNLLRQRGAESYAMRESDILAFLKD